MPREFHGAAEGAVSAPIEECFDLVAAVDRYPEWCSEVVREVEVLERTPGGEPSRVRMRVHISRAGIEREFDLFLAVAAERPREVRLRRVTDHPTNQEFDVTWLLSPGERTRISLTLDAKLRVPRYIPAGGVADRIAEAFMSAATTALGGAASSG